MGAYDYQEDGKNRGKSVKEMLVKDAVTHLIVAPCSTFWQSIAGRSDVVKVAFSILQYHVIFIMSWIICESPQISASKKWND